MNKIPIESLANVVPVSSIMTRDVISVHVDDPAELVRAMLTERRISGAPVVDDFDRVCGVVTKTDLVRDSWIDEDVAADRTDLRPDERAALGNGFHVLYGAGATVREVMTPYALCVVPETSIARVSATMVYEGVHRVFVSTREGQLLGVVSLIDIARWTAQQSGFLVPNAAAASRTG